MIKVSVIIPTFGPPVLLENAMQSVLCQTLREFEMIIVDDNNPETENRYFTEKIVNKYLKIDSRLQYIQHDKSRNGAAARNTGFEKAQGKYISLLDSDDEYHPERLLKLYTLMEQASSLIAGVYSGCEFRKSGKKFNAVKHVEPGNFLVKTLACTFMFCTGSNIFVRKKVVDELNGFDVNFLRHQDYEFLVRLFQNYYLEAIPELLVIKNNENLNLPDINKQINIKNQYAIKFKSIIENLPKKEQNYIYHCHAVGIAEGAMRTGNYKVAKQYYTLSKQYGSLTSREIFRLVMFPIINIFQ